MALKPCKCTISSESAFRQSLKDHKEHMLRTTKHLHGGRIVMPHIDVVFEKKGIFKHCLQQQTPATQGQPCQMAASQPNQSQTNVSLGSGNQSVQF